MFGWFKKSKQEEPDKLLIFLRNLTNAHDNPVITYNNSLPYLHAFKIHFPYFVLEMNYDIRESWHLGILSINTGQHAFYYNRKDKAIDFLLGKYDKLSRTLNQKLIENRAKEEKKSEDLKKEIDKYL